MSTNKGSIVLGKSVATSTLITKKPWKISQKSKQKKKID